jgi:hypothetical protein
VESEIASSNFTSVSDIGSSAAELRLSDQIGQGACPAVIDG